ncbi:TetR/AcrR family transcriptional regulator [Paenibacillus segetis]|uniref:TetR family transcriptional regulator n=1 Tax=Paenibacillus segetis TaxID=1325360 RepID=A0ABQ1YTZ0_9BACL|nr:TetR/AcrR family transcriptional regulator C-terminal domain-containing protein [Paenibacillus segetis]GGH36956.1 TetR family transcriptional regulator [Paenibacillus segetis]
MSIKLDPRIKRTLHLISDALLSLIEEKGFDHITVRDITSRAEINRATFYLHYQDKYDLLDKIVDEKINEFATVFQLPPGFEIDDFVKDVDTPPDSFVRQFEHIADYAKFYKVMLGAHGLTGFAMRMEEAIRKSLYHRSIIAQPHDNQALVPRELVVRYATSAHLGLIMYWLENNMPYTPKYMAIQLIRLHVLGPTQLMKANFK